MTLANARCAGKSESVRLRACVVARLRLLEGPSRGDDLLQLLLAHLGLGRRELLLLRRLRPRARRALTHGARTHALARTLWDARARSCTRTFTHTLAHTRTPARARPCIQRAGAYARVQHARRAAR
eukprot:6198754-Pleurochrysis_carterae.AAC.2